MKLCKDCRWLGNGLTCQRRWKNPVDGIASHLSMAATARECEVFCGVGAKGFEKKEPQSLEHVVSDREMVDSRMCQAMRAFASGTLQVKDKRCGWVLCARINLERLVKDCVENRVDWSQWRVVE